MMKILHVSCSPRGQAAESYRLSQKIIGLLLEKESTAVLVNRVIGGGAISHVDENYAISQSSSADISQEGSIAQSEELIQELESSDVVELDGKESHWIEGPPQVVFRLTECEILSFYR